MSFLKDGWRFLAIGILLMLPALHTQAQSDEWVVDDPHGPFDLVEFETDEGTWMNLDVSPDGKEIVFDLLGDIYILPALGGDAKLLRGGMPYEVQPRFSPDGKQILFTSDAGGGDNIWVMNRDGSDAKQITKEDFRLLNNGVWMPDGQYIVARKHFTSRRSLGAGEMWMYHITGGSGIQLTQKRNSQMDAGEPCFSPDGRYVYYSEDMSPGQVFEYNKNPHDQIYVIKRYDTQTGEIETVVSGPGGAVRPQISPDGKLVAFVRRVRLNTVLFIHDLQTGEEWPVYDKLNKDQQETWAVFGVYPNYNFMPDGQSVIIWAGGKIQKVDIMSASATTIPFKAKVSQKVAKALKFKQDVLPEKFTSKMIRHAATSPSGKEIIFNAAGHLYTKQLPKGKPARLTGLTAFEFEPAYSPDGKSVVFTTWEDENMGAVQIWTDGSLKKVTTEKGFYHSPEFSPDGKWIVFQKGSGNSMLGYAYGKETGIYLASASGSEKPVLISEEGSEPRFSPDGKSVWFFSWENGSKALKSLDLKERNVQTLFTSQYATEIVPSPDGKWIAFTELYNAYICPFPQTGKPVDLSSGMRTLPVYQLSRDAGYSLHWTADSKEVCWLIGPEYFRRSIDKCFTYVSGADSLPPVDTVGIELGLELKSDIPESKIALTGARIITMKGDEVIENGTILVENNRIKVIGNQKDVKIPSGYKTVDVSGKTIMPGIVDVHAHMGQSWNGISPQQQWTYLANLAYGVTTTHDPSANTEMIFSQAEMQRAGLIVAPRIFSTGTILYGAEGDFKAVINSLDDARSHLRRMKAVGAFSVKSYNQPRRNQRQQVIQAARELNMMVYPEGGSFFFHNMSMILDGHTGVEHSIPVAPVYKDVITLWGNSKTGYTPTLIVGYGGIWGENYWYQKTEVWKNERLLKYYPRSIIDARSMRRPMVPDEDFGHFENAKSCKAIADGGAKVQLGAHGQLHGLGAHWELWMLEQGGFSPMEALRAATLWGAEYIGMDHEIGSLEAGKLADLVILDANPLENLRNSEQISYVMLNGRMYNAETMNEVHSGERKRLPMWWEGSKGYAAFEWHEETHSFMDNHCGCFVHP